MQKTSSPFPNTFMFSKTLKTILLDVSYSIWLRSSNFSDLNFFEDFRHVSQFIIQLLAALILHKHAPNHISLIVWIGLFAMLINSTFSQRTLSIEEIAPNLLLPLRCFVLGGSKFHLLLLTLVQTSFFYILQVPNRIFFNSEFASNQNQKLYLLFPILMILQCIYLIDVKKLSFNHKFTKIDMGEHTKRKQYYMEVQHELRNLLNNIDGNLQFALSVSDPIQAKKHIQNSKVCSEIATFLINNNLDSNKIERAEMEISPKPVKIHKKLNEIWNACNGVIERKGLKGSFFVSKNIPSLLEVDFYRLSQIIFNLVSNAAKFTDKGSIKIVVRWIGSEYESDDEDPFDDEGIFNKNFNMSIVNNEFYKPQEFETRESILETSKIPEKGKLRIQVIDSGNGINEKNMSILFERFKQVTEDQDKRQLGTGLGLYITKSLCEKMKGDIKVFSQKNIGTAFNVEIPMRSLISKESISKNQLVGIVKNASQMKNLNKELDKAISQMREVLILDEMKGDLEEEIRSSISRKTSCILLNLESTTLTNFCLERIKNMIETSEEEKKLNFSVITIEKGILNPNLLGMQNLIQIKHVEELRKIIWY